MLRLEDLLLARGDFLLGASVSIPRGARVAILGPSGAGKSTLLDAIGGFLAPDHGRILWEGRDITAVPPADRPVAMIFQDNNLFPHLTVARNVGLGLRPNGRLDAADRARVLGALADVGLDGMAERRPADLSGGQQSRVALARVGLQDRPILLLDEAFAALGPAMKREMIALVTRFCDARDLTLLMVTHDPEDARRLDGDIMVVADGGVSAPAPARATLADPPASLAAYLAG
ncbi:ATP-binding cassette domain-containing protein [Palleronia sp. LCG004]|uniref:thiamine ABC transporter ATP-binding protein n=1 Tax=Palleronia sp. LCG004 TaxID=3079304 RepID=UPI0029420660|nr:ATP-binding cassette domain-containing protein [Palleronia sp. LCG004]WOI56143.1 ATP-binding cassette domain-containing protein [Palleronia sp. LCG004]